jgi:hypothetical protein
MSISHLIASYGYWAVFVLVGLESLGIPLPGETALIIAGADRRGSPADRPGRGIEPEIAHGQDGRPLARVAPDQGPDPGPELLDAERLREVVVGAGVQGRAPGPGPRRGRSA